MNTTQQTILNIQEDYLEIWIRAFLQDRQGRNLSRRTVLFYKEKLELFASYCESHSLKKISELTPTFLREFLIYLEASGHNSGGVHIFFRAVKAFLRWLWDELDIDYPNPIQKVKAPRVPGKQLDAVDYQDVLAMIETCGNNLIGRRDRAIMMFLPDCGVRASELLGILLSDVDIISGQVFIRDTKGSVPRNIYLGSNSLRVLRRYLKTRRDTSPALWITADGSALSYWGLVEMMRRRSEIAGVPQPSLHSFRRYWAVNFLRNGGTVFALQRAGGWKSLQAIRPYVKLNENDIQTAMRQHSPIDNLRG